MKRALITVVAVLLLAGVGMAGPAPPERNREAQSRSLSGQVTDKAETPLNGAVVYLKNLKTLGVKTFITDAGGNYRFPGLSPNVDYEVYAEYKGHKSDTKTLSSFDSRTSVTIYLRINTRQ